MTTYLANFGDGTSITQEATKPFTHAWRLDLKDGTSKFGFSTSQELAYKALNRAFAKAKFSLGWDIVPVNAVI